MGADCCSDGASALSSIGSKSAERIRLGAVHRLGLHLAFFQIPGQGAECTDFVKKIGNMQEAGFFQADIDECRLHPGQHAHHPAFVNVAGQAALGVAFDHEFGENAIFQKRDSHLQGGSVNNQFAFHTWLVSNRIARYRNAR